MDFGSVTGFYFESASWSAFATKFESYLKFVLELRSLTAKPSESGSLTASDWQSQSGSESANLSLTEPASLTGWASATGTASAFASGSLTGSQTA